VDSEELESSTFRHLPEAFIQAALRSVFMAHQVAYGDCRANFASTEAENVVGYYRRGKLEGYLRDAAARFPQIEATAERSSTSGWNHTEIRSGPVVLTETSVQVPCDLVTRAEFRMTLAQSNQLSFWDDSPSDGNNPLYVLLLHSRSRWEDPGERDKYGHLPGSAYLAYPSPDLDFYLHQVNLFERYPEIVTSYVPQEWDAEVHVRYLARARRTSWA
jgi:hypothetical protein